MVQVEQENIRGLDIDKVVKGFALVEYKFKQDCTVTSTSSDSVRWYTETNEDLTATSPMQVQNISPLSTFPTLNVEWTRNTSYVRKYAAESFISMEDIKGSDISVLTRTLLRLTRAVVKQVDTRIWDVMTVSRVGYTNAATDINFVDSSGAWNLAASDPIGDILKAKKFIYTSGNYNPEGASLWISPNAAELLMRWLYFAKGSNLPSVSADMARNGTVASIAGVNVKVSPNVTADYGLLIVPQVACTWRSFQDTTSRVIDEPGLGSKVRVWEIGEAYLTDPRAAALISNIE